MRLRKLFIRSCCIVPLILAPLVSTAADIVVNSGERIQDAVNKAVSGDTVRVMPGLYEETVYIDKDDVNLIGIIVDGARPILDGSKKGLHDGIIASGHGVIIEGFHVRNYRSNGITTQGANNYRIHNNIVENIHLYGIFPQFGKNGLVSQNIISRTSDAGIYVGMSENIDIIANEVFDNALGIEAENSHYILIEANYVHDNSVGIPVVIIPGLQTKTSADVIVRNNTVVNNNSKLYNRDGAVMALMRTGRGITVTAVDRVTIEGNIIRDHQSCGICVMSMSRMGNAFPVDAAIEPEPDETRIIGNIFVNNGFDAVGLGVAGASIDSGADIVNLARGNAHCYASSQGAKLLGVSRWAECDPALTSADVQSYQLAEPVRSQTLSRAQKAKLTYHAVCSGCHAYAHTMIGPPMMVVQALYINNPEGLAQWISAPTKKRPLEDYPAMPPQDYLSEELRLDLAKYILEEVGAD
jgi:parallel beta-helix repeat protein